MNMASYPFRAAQCPDIGARAGGFGFGFEPAGADVWRLSTPRRALNAIFGIREVAGGGFGRSASGRKQLAMHAAEGLGCTVIGAQPKNGAPGVLDQPPRPVDQLLDHRFDAPALGTVAHRRVRPEQATLADQAQDVHRQGGELAHQIVGVELARGQARQVQVGLELGVKLLVRAVVAVQRDDVPGLEAGLRQAGRPALQLQNGEVRQHGALALRYRALRAHR